jgi:hypothetical protein
VLGLLVSIAGFIWTLRGVYKSRAAAEAAAEAAEKAREDILRSNALIELAEVMSSLQEIKRLQREEAWPHLLDRYSILRTALIAIRASRPNLSDQHKTTIQSAIGQLRTLEEKIERAMGAGQKPNVAKLNAIVSDQLDGLSELLGALRSNGNG